MSKQEIKETVNGILLNEMGLFESDIEETKTLEEAGMDSLDVLYFISICEEKFDIEAIDKEILSTYTIQNVVDHIYNCKN